MKNRIVISATHAVEPVQSPLTFWLTKLGLSVDIQLHEELLDPLSLLQGGTRGLNVVLLRLEDWASGTSRRPATVVIPAALERIDRQAAAFAQALCEDAARSRARHLICICPPSNRADPALVDHCAKVEARIVAQLSRLENVEVLGSTETATAGPSADAAVYFAGLATIIARRAYRTMAPAKRALVLGCADGTWTKADPAELDRFWRWIHARHALGLAIAATGGSQEVVDGLLGPRVALLAAREAGPAHPAERLAAVAETLQMSLADLAYLDCDGRACQEIAAACPQVLSLCLPDADPVGFLERVWALDGSSVVAQPPGAQSKLAASVDPPWALLATDLRDGASVLAAMTAGQRRIRDRHVLDTPFVAPRTALEEQLAALWISVLAVDRVGIADNFFEIGGDSLLETQVLARLHADFSGGAAVRSLFETPTVEQLALVLATPVDPRATALPSVVVMKSGQAPGLFLFPPASGQVFPYLALARALGGGRAIHALRSPELEPDAPLLGLAAVVDHYVACVLQTQPSGPFLLAGWSYGSVLAIEAGRRLVAAGLRVATVVMLDPPAPRAPLRHAMGASRAAALLSWIALHAPRLGRSLPIVGRLLATNDVIERLLLSLPLHLDRPALERLLAFVRGECPPAPRLASDQELYDALVATVKAQASEADLGRYFIPGLSSVDLVRAAQVWKHDLLLGVGYRAARGVLPFRIDAFVADGDEEISRWAPYSTQPLRVHQHPIRAVGSLSAHLAFVEPENVARYASQLASVLAEAIAACDSAPQLTTEDPLGSLATNAFADDGKVILEEGRRTGQQAARWHTREVVSGQSETH